MSADNWAICPKCRKKTVDAKSKQKADADAAYGKVPADKYIALRSEAEKPCEHEHTLRENYELWINPENGQFDMSYKAECTVCGFSFTYEHTQKT